MMLPSPQMAQLSLAVLLRFLGLVLLFAGDPYLYVSISWMLSLYRIMRRTLVSFIASCVCVAIGSDYRS